MSTNKLDDIRVRFHRMTFRLIQVPLLGYRAAFGANAIFLFSRGTLWPHHSPARSRFQFFLRKFVFLFLIFPIVFAHGASPIFPFSEFHRREIDLQTAEDTSPLLYGSKTAGQKTTGPPKELFATGPNLPDSVDETSPLHSNAFPGSGE
jgi:hypothetical protein